MPVDESAIVGWIESAPGEAPLDLSPHQYAALLAAREQAGEPMGDVAMRRVLGLPLADRGDDRDG